MDIKIEVSSEDPGKSDTVFKSYMKGHSNLEFMKLMYNCSGSVFYPKKSLKIKKMEKCGSQEGNFRDRC